MHEASVIDDEILVPSLSRNSFTKFFEKPLPIATPFCPAVTGTDMESRRFQNTICGTTAPYPASVNFLVIAS